jgi:CxxC-x17-CxxC domain-containing protein
MIFVRDFNRDRNSGGRSGGGRSFPRRDFDRPQEMHQAICSNCGKTCEVPFKPNGSKPVFCRECFQANRTGESRRPDFEGRNNNFPPPPPRSDDREPHQPPVDPHKEQFEAINAKLDRILNLLNESVKKPVVATPVVIEPAIIVEPKAETPKEKTAVVKRKASKKSPVKK